MENADRYVAVVPSERQLNHAKTPFYAFIHFGMNTFMSREWGTGKESPKDFDLKNLDTDQWASVIKKSGAKGIILTCKHHDGFCLFQSKYTEHCIKNSSYKNGKGDVVKELSESCKKYGLKFGVYLSPWDMHDERYGTDEYNDYFVNQLTELLTNYGDIFEVWFDGAKGKNAKDFTYDWDRYYKIIRELQPNAVISICGPDIRWVGNEGGKTRKNEFSVVPKYLMDVEKIKENSQNGENQTEDMKKLKSTDEDLGSREVLDKAEELIWYPAEVDVSIRKGWFYHKAENLTVKSGKKLFELYKNSVGKNCSLLLNVPPSTNGVIENKDKKALEDLGNRISNMTHNPVFEKSTDFDGADSIVCNFDKPKNIKTIILKEDISKSQRVEEFDVFAVDKNRNKYKIISETIIGSERILSVNEKNITGIEIRITKCRENPYISFVGIYE